MKKSIKILLFFLMLIIVSSCSKNTEPTTGNFEYQLSREFSPVNVSFTISGNGLSYTWDFGDNSVSTLPNPQHLFETPGTYTVKCSISGPGGAKEVTKTVNIPAKASKVAITKLVLKTWPPLKPDNSSWDILPTSGPDIFYLANIQGSSTAISSKSTIISNALTSAAPYNFNTTFDITDFSKPIEFRFYDDDGGVISDDFMGGIAVNFDAGRSGSSAYPSTISLNAAPFSFDLYVTWLK